MMAFNIPHPTHSPIPRDPGLTSNTEPTINPGIPTAPAQPPGPALLMRLEDMAYDLPSIVQNRKAMAWMAALPIALGALNCANGNYLASVPCFVTGAAVLGTVLFRTVFYPPALISPQFFNRLFPNQA